MVKGLAARPPADATGGQCSALFGREMNRPPEDFLAVLNARSQDKPGQVLPVLISIYNDKSFDFVIKTPPAAVLIMESIKLAKGSKEPNRAKVGSISWDQIKKIAELKMPDLNAFKVDSAMKMVAGTARSMGVTVSGTAPWDK